MANPNILTPLVREFASREFLTVPRMNDLATGVNTALRALADLTPEEEQPFVPPLRQLTVIPTGVEAGTGVYHGNICTMRTNAIDPASPVSLSTIGNADPSEEIVIVNEYEVAFPASGTAIAANGTKSYPARWSPAVTNDDPPRRVAIINAIDVEACP